MKYIDTVYGGIAFTENMKEATEVLRMHGKEIDASKPEWMILQQADNLLMEDSIKRVYSQFSAE